ISVNPNTDEEGIESDSKQKGNHANGDVSGNRILFAELYISFDGGKIIEEAPVRLFDDARHGVFVKFGGGARHQITAPAPPRAVAEQDHRRFLSEFRQCPDGFFENFEMP